jgi:hypothetical protein
MFISPATIAKELLIHEFLTINIKIADKAVGRVSVGIAKRNAPYESNFFLHRKMPGQICPGKLLD